MQILRATHLGMCFGVRDAIHAAITEPRPLTILGDLVHNPVVLDQLTAHGVRTVRRMEDVQTEVAMITAHGASQRTIEQVRARGLTVLEATCPLVHAAHRALLSLVSDGFHPVIVGQRGHVEVNGLTGDLDHFSIVLEESDLATIPTVPRIGVMAQTTQPLSRVRRLVQKLQELRPASEIRLVDTVCQPTKLRQQSAIELAQQVDLMIVIGGAHSNNTRELAETCRRLCPNVRSIQGKGELQPEWFVDVARVGITAGTSTPDQTIDEVEEQIRQFARSASPWTEVETGQLTAY